MTEKPWWDDEKYNERMFDGLMLKTNIAAIVAEAERRGRLAAWKEARDLCDDQRDAIDEKIAELKRI